MTGVFVGTAGWGIPKGAAERMPGEGTHLERYARALNAVEINSSFYRPHQRKTYARWASSTPEGFRFSVKMPKAITHEKKLAGADDELDRFFDECGGLGEKLSVILVQLPPKQAYDERTLERFFVAVRQRYSGHIAFEPRHASFYTADVEGHLARHDVARVVADPQRHPDDARPGGYRGFSYTRLHGAPRIYYSAYDAVRLTAIAETLRAADGPPERWCIFDNTAMGHAAVNALDVMATIANSCTARRSRA